MRELIKEIQLINFMSYDNVRFDLRGNFVVIVGKNWAGKTSIVNGIKIALGYFSRERHRILEEFINKNASAGEVRIVLEKDGKEVEIIRILRRSRSSIFKVNGKNSTARQVKELAREFGIDIDNPLFVISGDEIDRLAKIAPRERTRFLIEALGLDEVFRNIEDSEIKLANKSSELEELRNLIEKEKLNILEYQRLAEEWKRREMLSKKLNELYEKRALAEQKEKLIEFQKLESLIREQKMSIESTKKEIEKVKSDIEKLLNDRNKILVRLSEAINRRGKLEEEYDTIELEIDSIDRIMDQRMRTFIKNLEKGRKIAKEEKERIMGPFIDFIKKVERKYARAVESALWDVLGAYITQSESKAIDFLLKRYSDIPVSILIPPKKLEEDIKIDEIFGIEGSVAEKIELESGIKDLVERILRNIYIVRTVHLGIDLAQKYGISCVTLEGFVIKKEGNYIVLKGPSPIEIFSSEGYYFRKIFELEEKRAILKKKLAEIRKEQRKIQELIDQLNDELRKIDKAISSKEQEVREKELIIDYALNKLKINERKLAELKEEVERINIRVLEYDVPRLKWIMEEIKKTYNEILSIRATRADVEKYVELKKRLDELSMKYNELLEEKESLEKLISSEKARLKDMLEKFLAKINEYYKEILSSVNARGHIEYNAETMELELYGSFGNVPEAPASSGQHSSGAKTLMTMAFILSVHKLLGSSTYILDEFDIHVDIDNRRKLVDMIAENSKSAQYIVLTPLGREIELKAERVIGIVLDPEIGYTRIVKELVREEYDRAAL